MKAILNALVRGESLPADAAEEVLTQILSEDQSPEQVGAFLALLAVRPPTAELLTGFVRAFKKPMLSVPADTAEELIDVCGTGGDGLGSFNISTTVAFVTAASGQAIAKHGNRAVSSQCGSFDVLEALGIEVAHSPEAVLQSLKEHKLAFLFAPTFHPSFAKLAAARRSLGFRTLFNALGPLLNPAGVKRQLIGVYSEELVLPMAEALRELGSSEALIVSGEDGCDEISICGPTQMAHLKDGKISSLTITPEDFGLNRAQPQDLLGGDAELNAEILRGVLRGEAGPRTEVVLLNSAAALLVAGRVDSLREGLEMARCTIQSGAALRLLESMTKSRSYGAAL